MVEDIEGVWEVLRFDDDYEIYNQYPYPVRKITTQRINSEWINQYYYKIKLNGTDYLKHRIIAQQFIPNDDPKNKKQVDHINRDKLDNRIENLRWVNVSENSKNKNKVTKQSFEYVSKLPDTAIQITEYDGLELDRCYYDFENVWNRRKAVFHSTFSDSKRNYLGLRKDFWQSISKTYTYSHGGSEFWIRFTTNGVDPFLPIHHGIIIELVFLVDSENITITH